MKPRLLDLFAGMGGWDTAARDLGLDVVGVEHDAAACRTRVAAGLLTIRQDVTTLDTARFRPLRGLIASPPCPTFSAAGNRDGIAELPRLIAYVHGCITGWRPYEQHDGDDPRSALVLEPLRFALECVPEWIALEQVPDVLPVWQAYTYVLRACGWSVWCGILNAADYGVPQTRRRAILIAHRRKVVVPPEPTHCRGGASGLFGELLPWVSMAEALGWGRLAPAPTQVGDARLGGATSFSRAKVQNERDAGEWQVGFPRRDDRGDSADGYRERDWRDADEPAFALTEKARSWTVRGNNTIAGGPLAERKSDEPAMTVGGQWWWTAPATTLGGDPRVSPRCHHDEGMQGRDALAAAAAAAGEGTGDEPVKLTIRDALVLQSFPPDYPMRGTKTKQFEQVGNAIPPRLARAILGEVERVS